MLKTTGTWALTILLIIFFLYVGYKKLAGNPVTAGHFHEWGYGPWLLYFVGTLECIGAMLLVFPATATSGALLLALIVTCASFTLLSNGVYGTVPITSTCLVLLLILGYLRWKQSWIVSVFQMQ